MAITNHVYWTVCKPGCSTIKVPVASGGNTTTDWGTTTAGFGTKYQLYGYQITPELYAINNAVDPDDPGYDPSDPNQPLYETLIDTYTHSLVMDTNQRDQIHPAIELYDGAAGVTAVAGIIDGTYYVYPVVFQDSQFCYLPRCSTATGQGEKCIAGEGVFPLEPYDPDCSPPIYPMDSITAFVPSGQTEAVITYTCTWTYNLGTTPTSATQSHVLTLNQKVLAPSANWQELMMQMMSYTYFYNGIYH